MVIKRVPMAIPSAPRARAAAIPPVGKAAGGNDGNINGINQRRDKNKGRYMFAVRRSFMARRHNAVSAVILRAFGVTRVNNRGNYFSAVGMRRRYQPIAFAQRKINDGHLFWSNTPAF